MEIALAREAVLGQQRIAALGQEDTALLKGLADGGDAKRLAQPGIGLLDAAAGEDQGAAGEINRLIAHDHEDLKPRRAVAQQQDGGGWAGGGGFTRHGYFLRG